MKFPGKLVGGISAAALVASAALAQESSTPAPANPAPARSQSTGTPQPATLPPQGESVAEAFAQPVFEPLLQAWTVGQATRLVAVIEGIGAEGLEPKDYDLEPLKVALASGPSKELNELASQSFVWLVEDLRDGRTPMDAREQWFVVDPDRDLYPAGKIMAEALASGDIAGTLAKLNPTHPDYAKLKTELAATSDGQTAKRKLIRANMDRWRWLQRDLGSQYLITNVPEFQLRLTVKNRIISTYRTIVGKPGRTATPQLAEMVEGVVFNPTWTVPQSIVKGEGLGARVLANPAWGKRNGYVATKGANGYITVVQQPGPGNSLGQMKLEMPNAHAIFFHDTPSRHLFGADFRALSHGCVRTERALELAMTMAILGKGATKDEAVAISTSGKYTKVMLEKQWPAYITYFTMASDINGQMATFKDIYGRDTKVLASLDKPRVRNRTSVPTDEVIVIEDDLQDS
ncbi:murein L,D-transpeptidase YcbB/YkuD [Erythromicrobium ramosum]|uniref:L,D-transpeptidase family protein n=1 Tax=Erythrobacter ramosus TaxID=35811 RepID=A0A6I4UKE5_9SPHN|nr:L,D-transpeptidase family protein [Erythrobacter ramosus]MBB3774275.1 murein L,D-transpeptidase YcbB/YkuD [Erythrobacter ramosus]MXP38067.1 L,D-transpeptidase family protein [Erythrobacter ramosus]